MTYILLTYFNVAGNVFSIEGPVVPDVHDAWHHALTVW